jgi:hypothetical protein
MIFILLQSFIFFIEINGNFCCQAILANQNVVNQFFIAIKTHCFCLYVVIFVEIIGNFCCQ